MSDPVAIDKDDRRFNVGKYQPNKLEITDAELATLHDELQKFHDFLMGYSCDKDAAGTVIQSTDRDTMISISESAIDTVSNALLQGNMGFFIDQLPTDESHQRNALLAGKVEAYKMTLQDLMKRTGPTGKCNVARDEMRNIYEYVIGKIPESPNKFTSLLKHHRVHTSAVWVNGKTVNGISTAWSDHGEFVKYIKDHFTAAPAPKAKAKP